MITLFDEKGEPLSKDEMDNNFRELYSGTIGKNQSWQSFTAIKVPNVTYTNTEDRTIFVAISAYYTTGGNFNFKVDGNNMIIQDIGNSQWGAVCIPVPVGSTYSLEPSNSTSIKWYELRETV